MVKAIPAEVQSVLMNLGFLLNDFSFTVGGCINQAGKVNTQKGDFFLKWNDSQRFPQMFACEASGLKLLSSSNSFRIPEVITTHDNGNVQFILLEYIHSSRKRKDFWEVFGRDLALLHAVRAEEFGLKRNNFIGSLPQNNSLHSAWADFFAACRLEPQLDLATRHGLIDSKTARLFEKLMKELSSILIEEKPSLVHGDLWSGNLMVDDAGLPCLIDPAVYFGHREVDLAMMDLFGGFDRSYFSSYNEALPLQKGYEERLRIYQLYPILVHVNLFGKSYVPQLVPILDQFV